MTRDHGLDHYLAIADSIPGWTVGEEAAALMEAVGRLPADAVIVEIGSFLGRSTVLLAGACELRGNGRVHSIDPFDGSGDAYSAPFYRAIAAQVPLPLRDVFDDNLRRAGLSAWVTVHQGTAERVAEGWAAPIDFLFLDGDCSPAGARRAFDAWVPFLKLRGTIALHNSDDRSYDADHDGHWRLAQTLAARGFRDIRSVGTTTFATRDARGRSTAAP